MGIIECLLNHRHDYYYYYYDYKYGHFVHGKNKG